MKKFVLGFGFGAAALLASSFAAPTIASADEDALVTFKKMKLEIAMTLAKAALDTCRENGFQVAVAVVDRFGNPQVLLRDRFAGAHTPDTATRKAWTAVSFRTNTSELSDIAKPGSPQQGLREINGALALGGGLQVMGGGAIVGGIGVSGAPGGAEDDACAQAGLDAVDADLNF
ncbi:MAG: GlcG/HbpS family heme-binding protein [Magnetovibrionaceae bacterium]